MTKTRCALHKMFYKKCTKSEIWCNECRAFDRLRRDALRDVAVHLGPCSVRCSADVRVDSVIVPKVAAIQFAGSAQWFERCNWRTGSAAPRLEVTRSSGH